MHIAYHQSRLPCLQTADAVVVGGTLAGVSAALALAAAGRRVVLVEPRTYLGRDVTATLRPWITASAGSTGWPPVVAAVLGTELAPVGAEIPLHMDTVKTVLEDLLLAAGVKLIYASLPVALLTGRDEPCRGLVIGNKSGRQAVACTLVVDATETAVVARIGGAEFEAGSDSDLVARTLEFTGVATLEERTMPVPAELGLVDDQVVVHPGYRGADHVLIECTLRLPSGGGDVFSSTRRDVVARRVTLDAAAYLLAEVPAFAKAFLAASSYELQGRHTPRMAGPVPAWAEPLQGIPLAENVPLGALAGPVSGIWCLNDAARLPEPQAETLHEPVAACRLGTALAQALNEHWGQAAGLTATSPAAQSTAPESAAGELSIREPRQPQRGRHYPQCEAPALALPVVQTSDVLVVGGGTSGATAAMTAGQQGMHTVLVEMNPGLGGTGTYGGIHTYWFGRRVGYAAKVMALVDEMHDRLRHDRQSGVLPTWSIEAKLEALLRAVDAAGVEIALNALVIGAVTEPDSETGQTTVRGIVVATRYGPLALLSKVVIDASGDGDVAAFAGAEYVYGSERDHALMYTYMAQVAQPGRPRNVKTSMVDVTNIVDYTRAIVDERRRRKERDHDHGIYVAPRESRHIKADLVLTLTDQLLRRAWPDVVNVAFSNNDIKGQSTSDWVMIGLISPNLEIEIPYRVLLPKGLENIIVAGKAFSATHDALAAPRMQPDIENLGGVAALAATLAVRSGCAPRTVDVRALQAQLVEAGVLPEHVLTRVLRPMDYSMSELAALVDRLDAERPLHAYSDMELMEVFDERIPLVEILCSGPKAVPVIEQALAQAAGPRQVLLAEALALAGSKTGVSVLVDAIQAQLNGASLPGRTARIRHANFPPDQNAAPDIAYILHALGAARDRQALPVWRRIVDLLANATADQIIDKDSSYYYYVAGVCFGAERLGDPAAVPILTQLHSYSPFRQHVHAEGMQPDFLQERMAYLELIIGRALARCGSPDGYVILISYLQDLRALMAEHAHTELTAITGEDFGKDAAAWGEWLEQQGDSLAPKPWLQPSDPVRVWGEVIYTPA